ncbi:hypothetical protein [Serratia microhaemolytica]|uniref:hypothetical protein n=1 Tax=Serratia microhaemolytica TaxID=2675110 RepID=UPI000FDD7200|nr:hypothetical protein [Serratia microhaemolytica]
MGLDLQITTSKGEKIDLVISESLHASIFSKSTRWSSCKMLRKISDYYLADAVFNGEEANMFLSELEEISPQLTECIQELHHILNLTTGETIKSIRVTGD